MQVISDPKPQERLHKAEPVVTKTDLAKQAATGTPVVPPPKVDYATDLFNLLSMDDSAQNDSETSSADDTMWASFQCMFHVNYFLIIGVFFPLLCCFSQLRVSTRVISL